MLKHATIGRTRRAAGQLAPGLLATAEHHWPPPVDRNSPARATSPKTNEHTQAKPIDSPLSPNQQPSTPTIKVYAQTLGQEVEYLTLSVNTQTQSRHIIRALLKKFRLKHRDPNLFYLTLERWIRKDGLRHKSVMLLADEACPLQLQQCCSNPPHNDIKFTLQMKAGALVKIFCNDVCPNTKYKCLSLSAQTSVAETIDLMLHCLDLSSAGNSSTTVVESSGGKRNDKTDTSSCSSMPMMMMIRQANSPDSTSSSASSTSSSSGIESDPTNNATINYSVHHHHPHHQVDQRHRPLDASSPRAESIASISSSDIMGATNQASSEQYCLLIECLKTGRTRVLANDDYLVEVYQNLLDDIREQCCEEAAGIASIDQWFVTKIKKRDSQSESKIQQANRTQPPPPHLIWMPQIQPRRRNLTNASSTFRAQQQQSNTTSTTASASGVACHRRRYDPAQLAEDLNLLNLASLNPADESMAGESGAQAVPTAGAGESQATTKSCPQSLCNKKESLGYWPSLQAETP
jgi:hypothetical protein